MKVCSCRGDCDGHLRNIHLNFIREKEVDYLRHLVSDYNQAPKSPAVRLKVLKAGEIGLSSLGLSFLFWAILMGGSMGDGGPMVFMNSILGQILGISSIGLTIAGIILMCSMVTKISLSRKYLLLTSSFAFAILNLAGYYFFIHSIYRGIAIPYTSNSFVIYLSIGSLIYFTFILIFNFFIWSFLNKSGRRLLLVASLFAVLYLVAITISTVYAPNNFSTSSIPTMPGDNMLSSVSFLSPFFGIPGFLLNDGVLNQPSWAMVFPMVSNLIYALLFFSSSKALKLSVTKIGVFD